ncbi:MAG: alpha/beta hydrolase [Candidatus Solibacter sp.]
MPLDPEIARYLDAQKSLPPRSSLDIAATRDRLRQAAALAGPPPDMARVENMVLAGYLRARQYWPSEVAKLPLLVYFHGGRFISGDLESHDPICKILAVAAGCRLLAVDYRLAPEHRFPAAAEDASLALEWALGQTTPVAVAGDSAGANLAAVAALAHRGGALRSQLLIYPMIDATCATESYREFAEGFGPGAADMQRGWREYLPPGADPRDPLASPLFAHDLQGAAPACVLTAEYDTLRDEGEAYAHRLGATLIRYPGAIHGFFTMPGLFACARTAIGDAAAFLKAHW